MTDIRKGDCFSLPYLLELRPASEFAYDAAKNKLVNLRVGSDSGPKVSFVIPGDVAANDHYGGGDEDAFGGQQAHLWRLSGWICVDSRLTVSVERFCLNIIR